MINLNNVTEYGVLRGSPVRYERVFDDDWRIELWDSFTSREMTIDLAKKCTMYDPVWGFCFERQGNLSMWVEEKYVYVKSCASHGTTR